MSKNWRITSLSGVLLAAYFVPTWATVAYNIIISWMRGRQAAANLRAD